MVSDGRSYLYLYMYRDLEQGPGFISFSRRASCSLRKVWRGGVLASQQKGRNIFIFPWQPRLPPYGKLDLWCCFPKAARLEQPEDWSENTWVIRTRPQRPAVLRCSIASSLHHKERDGSVTKAASPSLYPGYGLTELSKRTSLGVKLHRRFHEDHWKRSNTTHRIYLLQRSCSYEALSAYLTEMLLGKPSNR